MSIKTDLVIQQGAVLQKIITVTNTVTGFAFDLTDFDPRGQIRDFRKNLIAEFECSVYDALMGKIFITLSAIDTALIITNRPMKYTIEIVHKTDPDIIYRVAEGDATLSIDYCLPIVV